MSISVPGEYMCKLSKRIMTDPVSVIWSDYECTMDRCVYDRFKVHGSLIVGGRPRDLNATTLISESRLKEDIHRWLTAGSIDPGLADWRTDPVFRLKVYG